MKIAIIREDGAVYKDNFCYLNLDLSAIPVNVHALQFNDVTNIGWIEFKDNDDGTKPQNESITSLPDWAVTACIKWDEAQLAFETAKLKEEAAKIKATIITNESAV
jgi:hypothetical protein